MDLTLPPEIVVPATARTLTMPEVAGFSSQALPDLEADARQQRLEFTGPWIFVSHDLPQDATTTFVLHLCRPIAESAGYDGPHQVLTLPAMDCGTHLYKGPLQGIFAEGYAPLLQSLMTDDIPLTGEIREVYHLWTDPASDENTVEIQVGIVRAPAEGNNHSDTDVDPSDT
jgi:hypothetical protein